MSAPHISLLRRDAESLYAAGAFREGGVGGRKSSGVAARTRNCDICGLFDDAESGKGEGVGELTAREDMLDLMGDLKEKLKDGLGRKISDSMELQYLRYPGDGKGFYGRHLDHNSPNDDGLSLHVSKVM